MSIVKSLTFPSLIDGKIELIFKMFRRKAQRKEKLAKLAIVQLSNTKKKTSKSSDFLTLD